MKISGFLLFLVLLTPLLSADSFTLCYNNCNTCSSTDFTLCTESPAPCVYGYALFDSTCNPVPSFNNYVTQFAQTNNISAPVNWTSGGVTVTNTLTCNTIQPSKTINLIGSFSTQQVTRTFTVAPRQNMFVQLYFLRIGWAVSDAVAISISSGMNIIYNQVVTSTSYTSAGNINYLSDCEGTPAAQLWGAQITLASNTSSNDSTIAITFSPTISGSARWAFSNIKVSTGCGSFMVSHNGTCNSCLSGFYYNRITLDCQKCNPGCNSCFGPTNTNCLSCPLESVLNGNTCVYSGNFYLMNDLQTQTSTNNTSSCSNMLMLGGPTYGQINNPLSKQLAFNRHTLLKLNFWLVQIGDWSNITRFVASMDGVPFITITDFQSPGISPLCLKELGPVLVTTKKHSSIYMRHTNMTGNLTFSIEGSGNQFTRYGINGISLVAFNCPPQCSECDLGSNFMVSCFRCNQFLSQTSGCLLCPNGFYLDTSNPYSTICRKCYSTCLECTGQTQQNCTACFPGYMLVGSYCTPNTSLSYTLYSQQLTNNVFNFQDYRTNTGGDINCGPYRIFGNPNSSPTNITRTWAGLPAHKGLILNMQVFKIGPWTNGTNIILRLDQNQVITIPINESAGSFLCSGNSDFVYALSVPLSEHASDNLVMQATGTGGLAVSNVILSLQNCPDCSNSQFGYQVEYIPKYTLDNKEYGLNTWLKFNKNVRNVNVTELAQNFQLYINAIPLNVTEWDNINDLRLYTPFANNYSFVNGTLTILNKNPAQVISYANANIPPQQLTTIRSETNIARYDSLVDDDYLIPIDQLYTLFKGYTDAILYIAISLLGLGLGLVSQEFVAVLQIIFMHIYVMTHWLPATHKLPLSGMWRIQHLNYFMRRDINRIQGAILPKGLHQISPHTFEQFHTDINFVRASYPIVVLNLIYLAYWIIMYTLYRCSPGFRKSPNVVVRWFRQIVERPLNFFDYFFRLQFITVAWSCFCQFIHFNASPNSGFRGFNYFWTIIFFVGLCLYPFLMVCYLRKMRGITLKQTFNYQYEDIFFMRIKRNHDEMSSFIYILVRFFRYFIICCFMAFFASGSIVGPILCLIMTAVETLYIIFRSIYIDPFYLLFKLVENLFLFLLDIIYIIIFATANQWSLPSYLNLGYVANAFVIVLLINASLRALYILYLKLRTFCARNYRLDRAYNNTSFGFDYKPTPVMEMTRLSGVNNMGVGMGGAGFGGGFEGFGGTQVVGPPIVNNMNMGFGGIQQPSIPIGGNINMMGGNMLQHNMMLQNPIRTSTTNVINQGANFGVNPIGMNMGVGMNQINRVNHITTIPSAPINAGMGGAFGMNQGGFGQQRFGVENMPGTTVRHVRQQTHFTPEVIEYNTNNYNTSNIPHAIARGANEAIGRDSLHGGNLMLTSNVGGFTSSYAGNTMNIVEPYRQEIAYETNQVLRRSQVRY